MDPNFGLQPDYALNAVESCTLFATMLVQKDLLSLALCNLEPKAAAPNTDWIARSIPINRLEGLPSWVPDLRFRFVDFYAIYPEADVAVDEHKILTCPVREIGILRDAVDGTS